MTPPSMSARLDIFCEGEGDVVVADNVCERVIEGLKAVENVLVVGDCEDTDVVIDCARGLEGNANNPSMRR